jgi:uncharacterized BrkB/YihY/UPF0761 family membrane protein
MKPDHVDREQLESLQPNARERNRRERARLFAAAIQVRKDALEDRAQRERGQHSSVDAVFEMVDRDSEFGGGIIAGALAFRLFIWLLPFALVLVGGLGVAASASSDSPEHTAGRLGLAGLVSSSVQTAAKDNAHWYALLVGVPVLLFATRSVLRVLIGSHRILWGDTRAAAPRPKIVGSVKLLVLLLALFASAGLASAIRAWSPGLGILATLIAAVPFGAIWLLVSVNLPHRGSSWAALVPGAILFAVGAQVIQIAAAYLLAPYAIAKQGTYGALGVAAALLLALFFISRLVVGAAVLNATLFDRKLRRERSSSTETVRRPS